MHGDLNQRRNLQNLSSTNRPDNEHTNDDESLVDKCLKIDDEDLEALWHKRYEHLNSKSIQIMQQKTNGGRITQIKGSSQSLHILQCWEVFKEKKMESIKQTVIDSWRSLWTYHSNLSPW